MDKSLKILSYNIGSNKYMSGLSQLLDIYQPSLIFLQEVLLTTEHLNSLLGPKYEGACNTDSEDPRKPGTACIWDISMDVSVTNIVIGRCQHLKFKNQL